MYSIYPCTWKHLAWCRQPFFVRSRIHCALHDAVQIWLWPTWPFALSSVPAAGLSSLVLAPVIIFMCSYHIFATALVVASTRAGCWVHLDAVGDASLFDVPTACTSHCFKGCACLSWFVYACVWLPSLGSMWIDRVRTFLPVFWLEEFNQMLQLWTTICIHIKSNVNNNNFRESGGHCPPLFNISRGTALAPCITILREHVL